MYLDRSQAQRRQRKPLGPKRKTHMSAPLLTYFFLPKTKGKWIGMIIFGPEGDTSPCECRFFFRQEEQFAHLGPVVMASLSHDAISSHWVGLFYFFSLRVGVQGHAD